MLPRRGALGFRFFHHAGAGFAFCLLSAGVRTEAGPGAVDFQIGEFAKQVYVWGTNGTESRPACFPELLPGFFERTLVFDRMDASNGALSWIFTGTSGGITVRVEQGRIHLGFRYYDSYGFYPPGAPGMLQPLPRYPERTFPEKSAALTGPLRSLTVTLDRHLQCSVRANGQLLLSEPCLLTVSEHQIKWGGSGGALGHLEAPASGRATVTLRPSELHQAMIGFGGITSPLSYRRLSEAGRRRWWELLAKYNLVIQREYPVGSQLRRDFSNYDRAADALPHYYADNPNDSEISDFAYNRAVKALGGETWFEFWQLPYWMLGRPDAKRVGGLADERPDPVEYANAIVAYCRASLARAGFAPAIVGVQNEICQTPASLAQMVPMLRRKLDEAGFKETRINMANGGKISTGIEFARRHRAAGVWPLIDFAATNEYDAQDHFAEMDECAALLRSFHAATADKDFLATELCVNTGRYQTNAYSVAFAMAQLFQQNLTLADARAVVYCWLLMHVPEPSFGWTRMLFRIDQAHDSMPVPSSYMLRTFGAFSRRVVRDMRRVGATCEDPDILPAAFIGKKGRCTLVLLNRSTQPKRVAVGPVPADFTVLERADPYHENSVEPAPPSANGEVSVDVPPGGIVTLSSVELGRLPAGFVVP